MKNFTLFLLMLIATIGFSQTSLPIDFESGPYAFNDFGGTATQVITNPVSGGINTSANAAEQTRGGETWCGTWIQLDAALDFTTNNTFKMKVYSPAVGHTVRFKLENQDDGGIFAELDATTTVANEWEELSFNFGTLANDTYHKIVVFFNFGVSDPGAVYYFDDIQFVEVPSYTVTFNVSDGTNPIEGANVNINGQDITSDASGVATIDLEDGSYPYTVTASSYIEETGTVDVSGAVQTVNVTMTESPYSDYCESMAYHFQNPAEVASVIYLTITNVDDVSMYVEIESADTDPVDFLLVNGGSGATISDEIVIGSKIRRTLTWASAPTDVTMNILWSKESTGGNWQLGSEDITVPFSKGCAVLYTTTFSVTDGTDPIVGANIAVNSEIITTDASGEATIDLEDNSYPYVATASGYVEETGTVVVSGAEQTVNITMTESTIPAYTVTFTVTDGTDPIEGANIAVNSQNLTTDALGVATINLEDGSYPYTVTATDYDEETGTVDVSGVPQAVSVTMTETPSEEVTLPIDFETGPYFFNDFDGGVTTVISNPQSGGINTSANVAQQVRNGGATWAGSWILLDDYLDFTTNNTFTMKVYAPATGVPVLLKLEGDGGVNTELIVNTTVADEWEELSFNFDGAATDTYNKLVFIFNMGTIGAGEAYLFDDVEFIDGSGGLTQIDLPVTFEEVDVNYTVTDFGGNYTELDEDPQDASNTVAVTLKTSGAEIWAGTTISTPAGFASAIPFADGDTKMNVKIYSPASGITVRLKAEDNTNPTISVETDAITTMANNWETLEFDFSNEVSGTAAINFANTYNMASIFFDFGNNGDGAVYYWDDVAFGPALVSVDELNKKTLKVYPNPVSDVFVLGSDLKIKTLNIYNLNGQRVNLDRVSENSFNISKLASGVYTIHAIDINNNVVTAKIVKL